MLELNKVCRDYRKAVGVTLYDIERHARVAVDYRLLSAFENGRSSNMNHVEAYHTHAKATGNLETFIRLMVVHFNG